MLGIGKKINGKHIRSHTACSRKNKTEQNEETGEKVKTQATGRRERREKYYDNNNGETEIAIHVVNFIFSSNARNYNILLISHGIVPLCVCVRL